MKKKDKKETSELVKYLKKKDAERQKRWGEFVKVILWIGAIYIIAQIAYLLFIVWAYS